MRFSYSNVIASVALFIALGSGAYAASLGKDTVGSRQIKENAVKGIDVDESTLEQVPEAAAADSATSAGTATTAATAQNALKLGGKSPGEFAPSTIARSIIRSEENSANDYPLGRFGDLELALSCDPGAAAIVARDGFGFQQPFDFEMVRAVDGVNPTALTGSTKVTSAYKTVLPVLSGGEGQFVLSSGTFTYLDSTGRIISGIYSFSQTTVPANTTCNFRATVFVPND